MKGGINTMCDVIQGAKAEGKAEGKVEGKLEGRIESLYFDSKKTPEEISTIVDKPLEYVEEVLKI